MPELEILIAEFLALVAPVLSLPVRNRELESELAITVQPILDEISELLGVTDEQVTLAGILEVLEGNGQVNHSLN